MYDKYALERRVSSRVPSESAVGLIWKGENGAPMFEDAAVVDLSSGGMAFSCAQPIPIASSLLIRAPGVDLIALAQVRHCAWNRASYRVGVRFLLKTTLVGNSAELDDFLREATAPGATRTERIEQLYRALCFRYHPDNQQTGDAETFLAVQEIYRIAFANRTAPAETKPRASDFHAVREQSGREMERRAQVLALLYQRRLSDCEDAGLSVQEIGQITGSTVRELSFTLWYLREKKLVTVTDSAMYAVSIGGVELFESVSSGDQRPVPHNPALAQPAYNLSFS